MLHFLVQPQRELQLHLKTISNQNCHKIELYGPTTKDLERPHSSRWVGGVELQRWAKRRGDMVWHREEVAADRAVSHSHVVDKKIEIGRDILGASNPSHRPDHTA